MPKKRTSLTAVADALMADDTEAKTESATSAKPRQASGKKSAPVETARKTNTISEATRGAETIRTSVYIPLVVYKKLNELAITESTGLKKKVNDYFLEGIDEVFAKRGMSSIEKLVEKAKE